MATAPVLWIPLLVRRMMLAKPSRVTTPVFSVLLVSAQSMVARAFAPLPLSDTPPVPSAALLPTTRRPAKTVVPPV